eukprot:TRINITY_DN3845_c0_g1_i2.p3 TRINITY_DN3845_c0_g1~~TRINITY_DN3845_c0_g1_i2.p3  ORF type:complete len:168 (-),score=57.21 TRINITY_DN3845_c0_g1_i2:168-671(-)
MMIRALKGLLFLLLAGAASAMLPSIQGVFSRRFGPMDPPPPPPTPPSPPSSCMGGGSITAFVGEDCFYDESLSGTSQTKLEFSVYSLFTDDFSVETGYTCSAGGDCPAGFTVKDTFVPGANGTASGSVTYGIEPGCSGEIRFTCRNASNPFTGGKCALIFGVTLCNE